MLDRLGGMMVWGIPAFRLPPGIIQEDMERMLGHCRHRAAYYVLATSKATGIQLPGKRQVIAKALQAAE